MKTSKIYALVLVALLLGSGTARADDIDLYGQIASTGANPNIMILVDNASSNNADFPSTCPIAGFTMGKLMDAVTCALYIVGEQIGLQPSLRDRLNIGLMDYGTQSNQGGQWISPYFAAGSGPTTLPTMNQAGINAFLTLVRQLNVDKGTSNSRAAPSVFQESWAFFTGGTGLSGANYSNGGAGVCQKGFIIFIGAAAKQGHPAVGTGNVDLTGTTATAAQKVQINTSNLGTATGEDVAWTDEWARYLFKSNDIVTYTIAATGGNPSADYVQHLRSVATQGGGKAFVAADVNAIVQAILQVLNEVQAVNSAFASASLPVSVNTQGTYLNQVYIGMFRPDPSGTPRWNGNLKQYKFGVDVPNGGLPELYLADSTGARAISSAGTGFLAPTAVSFWTGKDTSTLPDSINPALGGFWINNPNGAGDGFDSPDGEVVEKGGAAQQLRLANLQVNYGTSPSSPRNLYTCIGSCATGPLSANLFATSNTGITATLLGLTAPTTAVSSISRNGTTVTVTLLSAPSPALTAGQSVTIAGAANNELNGNFTIALGTPATTTFTYTITENPPSSPLTGTYTATLPSSPKSIISVTRSGTTVTAQTAAAHGYLTGENITVSGANGVQYNGTFSVTVVGGAGSTQFTYSIVDQPAVATTGGTANIGTTGTNGITFSAAQIARGATAADNTSQVTISQAANLNVAYGAGAKVNVFSVTPSGYNVTLATIIAGAANGSCGQNGAAGKKVFCYSIATSPVSPDTGSIKQADRTGSVAISTLTHPVACTGGSPTASTVVTATTSGNHGFVTGDVVQIGGTAVPSAESAYVGSFTVTYVSPTQFRYTTTTTPPCAPSAAGVAAVTTPGGIDKDALINWLRGYDNIGDEQSPGNGITIRPSVHGDVLHSRPAIVNYGTGKIVAFYGTNDGVFRAVNANQSTSLNLLGNQPGGELWGFIAPEFFSKLARQYSNSPGVKLATSPTGITPPLQPRDYFFDGDIGVYQSNDTPPKVYIYLTARRGGRFIYALDVSDPLTPKFLWKKGCTSTCDTGFENLGQTWSEPKVALVNGYLVGGSPSPVLIFGAGYNPNDDLATPSTLDADLTMGSGIFVLDAITGAIVWKAARGGTASSCSGVSGATPCQLGSMNPIPAEVTLMDRLPEVKPDGRIERAYAADTGGHIWRVDFETAAGNLPTNWTVTQFAALGGADSDSPKRKFLFPPDVVGTREFDVVLASTGDREHPLQQQAAAYNVVNRFYMMQDPNNGIGGNLPNPPTTGTPWTAIVDDRSPTSNTVSNPGPLFDCTLCIGTSPTSSYDLSGRGFVIPLPSAGEKGVNKANSIGGYTYFGTNQPTDLVSGTCTNLGVARGYKVNSFTGATRFTAFDGGGLPPSPVIGFVTVDFPLPGGGTEPRIVPFLIGGGNPDSNSADARSPFGGGIPTITLTGKRARKYWNIEHDK